MAVNKDNYKEVFNQVARHEKFIEFLQKMLGQELLDLTIADLDVVKLQQGKVAVLQEILKLLGDTNE